MTATDNDLLRRYAEDRSEAAFAELTRRHLDLVYSAALRQVGGDVTLAEDATQTVFADLARKARGLTGHASLVGWLYTSTRFAAASLRRSEQRRRVREQEAHAMNQLLDSPDSEFAWRELRPVLDDAMHKLSAGDRDVVLWRFFERRSLAEVGERLGLSENAARMRVDRALERLRVVLAKQGVTSTVAGLAALLAQQAVEAAPLGLALRVGAAAAATASAGSLTFILLQIMTAKTKFIAASIAVAALTSSFVWYQQKESEPAAASALGTSAAPTQPAVAAATPATAEPVTEAAETNTGAPAVSQGPALQLTLLAADTEQPVPNVRIEYRGWEGQKFGRKEFLSNRQGISQIHVPRETITKLELTTRVDGFADTRLDWTKAQGQAIPLSQTLKLVRSVKIGGRVLDADGQPVAEAKVGFNHEQGPPAITQTESHNFGWIEVSTDADGRWTMDRIAPEMIRRLYGSARHPDYVNSPMIFVSRSAEAEQQLREATHVFQLGRAVAARGVVVDAAGRRVSGAKVLVGTIGESGRRESVTGPDGTFVIAGCKPGQNLLTASAAGFAATTLSVDISADSPPFTLVLQAGKILRLRVVNKEQQPVAGASIWLNTFRRGPVSTARAAPDPVQAECCPKTDAEGRMVWESAPDTGLTFDIYSRGYMRVSDFVVRPDGVEHVVTLPPALTVLGTVSDAQTGEPIPRFRMGTGWPSPNFIGGVLTNDVQWSTIDRFWITFSGGEFKHTYEEAVVGGTTNRGYVFKFEAEGYAPSITRTVAADEGEVRFTIALEKAASTTISVRKPGGQPAIAVDVGLASANTGLTITPGGFDHSSIQSGGALLVTDGQGQFKLPPDASIQRVFVSCSDGFAEAAVAALKANPVIQLLPWGRIEGTWLAGGKPATDRELTLEYGSGSLASVRFDFQSYRLKTDEQGKFRFAKVPPGHLRLVRLVPMNLNTGATGWTHQLLKEIDVAPGETTTVTLGASSYLVSARLRWPAGLARAADWQVMGGLATPLPQPPPELMNNPDLLRQWWQRPEMQALARSMRQFQFRENADGTFSADDVEPGTYSVRVAALRPAVEGRPPAMIAQAESSVTVPSEPASGTLDLGELLLQPVPVP